MYFHELALVMIILGLPVVSLHPEPVEGCRTVEGPSRKIPSQLLV